MGMLIGAVIGAIAGAILGVVAASLTDLNLAQGFLGGLGIGAILLAIVGARMVD